MQLLPGNQAEVKERSKVSRVNKVMSTSGDRRDNQSLDQSKRTYISGNTSRKIASVNFKDINAAQKTHV